MRKTKIKNLILWIGVIVAGLVFFPSIGACGSYTGGAVHNGVGYNFGTSLTTQTFDLRVYPDHTWWVDNYDSDSTAAYPRRPAWVQSIEPNYVYGGTIIPGYDGQVTITVNRAQISTPGVYTWHMLTGTVYYIFDPDYYDNTVTITKLGPASMSVTPTSYAFGAGKTTTFTLHNAQYGESFTWGVSSKPSWLTLSPSSGTLGPNGSVATTATVNKAGLEGAYNGTIQFSGGGNPSASVSMTAFAIRGYVKHGDGTGINAVTVTVKDSGNNTVGTATTQNNGPNPGWYEIKGLSGETYTVSVDGLGYTYSPSSSHSGTITLSASREDIDFYTYTINGYVTRSGTGINGINVTIKKDATSVATIPTTTGPGGAGYYEKKGLGGGTYTIQPAN